MLFRSGSYLFVFCSPILVSGSCLDYSAVRATFGWGQASYDPWGSSFVADAVVGLVATTAYALAGWILARIADRSFDRVIDRPRHSNRLARPMVGRDGKISESP